MGGASSVPAALQSDFEGLPASTQERVSAAWLAQVAGKDAADSQRRRQRLPDCAPRMTSHAFKNASLLGLRESRRWRAACNTARAEPQVDRQARMAGRTMRRTPCLHSASALLYAAELRGVKLLFRWERAHASPVEPNGEERTSTSERQTRGRSVSARTGDPSQQRKRRTRDSEGVLRGCWISSFMRAKGAHEGTIAPAGSPPQA